MGVLEDINQELNDHLKLTWSVKPHGQAINVDEDFTVTFTLKNTFAGQSPFVRYTNLFLRVDDTEFTSIPGHTADGIDVVPLPRDTLDPGDSFSVDVTMTATNNMGDTGLIGWLADIFAEERIFQARLAATVDLEHLFVADSQFDGYHEIEST